METYTNTESSNLFNMIIFLLNTEDTPQLAACEGDVQSVLCEFIVWSIPHLSLYDISWYNRPRFKEVPLDYKYLGPVSI